MNTERMGRQGARIVTATALSLRDMAGARLSPTAAAPTKQLCLSVLRPSLLRKCCGWGQPRSSDTVDRRPEVNQGNMQTCLVRSRG
jgi:hypothetical protein